MSKRHWEKWWSEKALPDFPRSSKHINGVRIGIRTMESPVRKMIVKETVESGSSVLDVGCATCIDYELFRDTEVDYTGVDLTEKFLDYARKLYPEINVKIGTALNLPFDDGFFDTVYCKSLIEHLHPNEWRDAVFEAWRVAKRKLMLCFVILPWDAPSEYYLHEEGYWNNHLNRGELVECLEMLKGFKSLRIQLQIGRHDLYIVEKHE